MKNHLSRFLALLFISLPVFAQDGDIVTVEEANASYFKVPRETLYLHVNKSTYVTGEEIWFKGYAYDRQNDLPSINSTNFEVEIFDEQGKEIYDGVFMGNNGSFQGNIKVDSTWSSGTYFMRASTHWMHNFAEDETYTKKIRIIKGELQEVAASENIQYDFQLLPEGGHLVSNTFNTIGFKLINDQGYGVAFDRGVIQDEQGNEVTTFSSNELGLGKFNLTPSSGKRYRALIKLNNGHEIEGEFPKVKNKGISMSVNNLMDNEVIMQFNTNESTIKDLLFGNYVVLIRKNHLSKKMKIYFKPKELEKTISISRSDLYKGMNTITLFKGDMPVLERLVFNPINIQDDGIKVSSYGKAKDSLAIEVAISDWDRTYDLSVSVLPSETKAYSHSDNMYSAMLLRPYIKGFIEDEKRYFTNVDRDNVYDLDLLLITQGWSKYKWENIFNNNPEVKYNFNQGFRITGKIQDKKREAVDKVYLYPTINNGAKLVEVNQDNTFEIQNFFPQKGEKLKISGVKSKGRFMKSGVYLQVQSDRIQKPFFNTFPVAEKRFNEKIQNKVVVPYNFLSDVQELDEVELKGSAQIELEKTSRIQIPKFFDLNSKKITLDLAERYFNIVDYLFFTGKFIITDRDNPIALRIRSRRSNLFGQGSVPVFIDGILIPNDNLGLLLDLRTAEVDKIYTDTVGYGVASRGGTGAGAIRIYTRRFPLIRTRTSDRNYLEYEFKKGFEPVKEFYNPEYSNYEDPFFINYGAIYWQPRLRFDKTGTAVFKIPNTGLENVTLHIEGMMSDGSLISKAHRVN